MHVPAEQWAMTNFLISRAKQTQLQFRIQGIENNSEESILGIESHRFQNQESESDSIPKISESNSPNVL